MGATTFFKKTTGSWMQDEELKTLKHVGDNVKISADAKIFGAENISIGSNVRIDAGTIILAETGILIIKNYVHIAAGCVLSCAGGIIILDHSQISFGCKLISASDDFSGEFLIGPTVPEETRKVFKSPICLMDFSVIGAGSIILPGTSLEPGAALGAQSMTKSMQTLQGWTLYAGIPAIEIKKRKKDCKEKALYLKK